MQQKQDLYSKQLNSREKDYREIIFLVGKINNVRNKDLLASHIFELINKEIQKTRSIKLLQIFSNVNQENEIAAETIDPKEIEQESGYNKFLDNQFLMNIIKPQKLEQNEDNDRNEEQEENHNQQKLKKMKTFLDSIVDRISKFTYNTEESRIIAVKDIPNLKPNDDEEDQDQEFSFKFLANGSRGELEKINNTKVMIPELQEQPMYIKTDKGVEVKKPLDFTAKIKGRIHKFDNFQMGYLDLGNENSNEFKYYRLFETNIFEDQQQPILIFSQNFPKFEIILNIENYYIRLEIEYQYVNFAFNEEEEDQISLYIKLLSPPYISVSKIKKDRCDLFTAKEDWIRVNNFFFDAIHDTLLRTFMISNTTICLTMPTNKESKQFSELFFEKKLNMTEAYHVVETLSLLKKKFEINQQNLTQKYQILQINFISQLPFSIKFNMLATLSKNALRIDDLEQLSKFLQEKFIGSQNIDLFIEKTEEAFRLFLQQANNISQYNNDCKQSKKNLKIFNHFYNEADKTIIIAGDRDNRLSYIRRLSLTPSGLVYGIKTCEMANRILRQNMDKEDYFIRLHFEDENLKLFFKSQYVTKITFNDTLEKGIQIFERSYELFAWSASQLRGAACWLFSFNAQNTNRQELLNLIGNFSGIRPVAKFVARVGQNFSSSILVQFKNKEIKPQIENDVYYDDKPYTDGIGKISKDLINEIRKKLKEKYLSCVQIRYAGAKGILALNERLENNQIILRKSMVKFDAKFDNELDILDFNKFRGGYINRQIIILLLTLGVKPEGFIELQKSYIEKLNSIGLMDASIYKYFSTPYNADIHDLPSIKDLIQEIMNAGYNQKNNLFLDGIFNRFRYRALLQLRTKCNILVEKAGRLLGIIDEYNILEEDEVYASYSEDNKLIHVITGIGVDSQVMVTRNPCLHPGDIRKAKAVSDDEIKQRCQGRNPFQPYVNCVVFPTKGFPMTAAMAGGDLDGDQYFITWDERLIPPKTVDPMQYDEEKSKNSQQPSFKQRNQEINQEEGFTVKEQLNFLMEYLNYETLGMIDNSHLSFADKSKKLALDSNCIELSKLHGVAVDFVKTGIKVVIPKNLVAKEYPDYMQKQEARTFRSETVLGTLYRDVKKISKDELQQIHMQGMDAQNLPKMSKDCVYGIYQWDNKQLVENYIREVSQVLFSIKECFIRILGYMNLYNIQSEYEIYSGNYTELTRGDEIHKKTKFNVENVQKKMIAHITEFIQYFKRIFSSKQQDQQKIRVSLFYLILNYSSQHLDDYDDQFKQFIDPLFKYIQARKDYQQLKNFRTWFRGLTWFLTGSQLLDIQKQKFQGQKNEINQEVQFNQEVQSKISEI